MIKRIILWIISLYQRGLSLCLPRCCRFHPSCSEYTCQALEKYGLWRGLFLGFCRLLRCAPWHPGGYDPVK